MAPLATASAAAHQSRPLGSIANLPAAGSELLADSVGAVEVPSSACVLALLHQPLGLGINRLRGREQRFQAKQREHLPEGGADAGKGPPVSLGDQLEEDGEGAGGVEVVREGVE